MYQVESKFLEMTKEYIYGTYREFVESIKRSTEQLPSIPEVDLNFDAEKVTNLDISSYIPPALDTSNYLHLFVLAITCIFIFVLLTRLARYSLPLYPMTKWGFRAKLIYADDNGKKRVFINKHYRLAVNPDFLYRLRSSHLAYIEYKSRNYIMESDITQLEIGVLALRGSHNVKRGAIALSNGEIHWIDSAKKSSRHLYRKNKKLIDETIDIKNGKWVKPVKKLQCKSCPMVSKCWG